MRLRLFTVLLITLPLRLCASSAYEEALNRGKTLLDDGNPVAAFDSLLDASKADPAQYESYFFLAVASYRMGNYSAAGEYATLALKRAPDGSKPQVQEMIAVIGERLEFTRLKEEGDAALGAGLNAKAASAFTQAYRKFPKEGAVGLQAASLLADRLNRLLDAAAIWSLVATSGDPASAEAARQELANRQQALDSLYQHWSAQFEDLKKSDNLKLLRTLAEAFPMKPEVQLHLASYHARKEDISRAVEHLKHASRLGTNSTAVLERPEFIRLLGVPGSGAFLKFMEDAFGAPAVVDTRTRFRATGLPAAENIANVQRVLLSGAFNLKLSDAAMNQLIQKRIQSFTSDRPFIAQFKAGSTDPWKYFNIGFTFPLRHGREQHLYLDSGDILDLPEWEEHPFDQKQDGPALKALVDHLSQTGIKPFLGLGENWKLVHAITEHGSVYSLSFATALATSVTSHTDVLKKLKETFGPFQAFESAPGGFQEYPKDAALLGGRFLFPSANGVTLDGRVFKSREYLVDAPWIVELRVSRMDVSTVLFHKFHEVDAWPHFFGRFSKGVAQERINAALQASEGLSFTHEGVPYTLHPKVPPFSFYHEKDNLASFQVVGRAATGESLRISYTDIDFSTVTKLVYPPDAPADRRQPWALRLSTPVQREIVLTDANGESTALQDQVSDVVVMLKGDERVLGDVLMAAFPPVARLSAADVDRLARIVLPLKYDAMVPFLKEADDQGKLKELSLLYRQLDAESRLPYLLRAAKVGDAEAMNLLRDHYEERWRDKKGTDKDRQQMIQWGTRAADAGNVESLNEMIDYQGDYDYASAERWLKALQAKREWRNEDRAQEILRRAALARKLKPLAFPDRVREWRSDLEDTLIGTRFKDFATPERKLAVHEKYKSERTGAKITVYTRGEPVSGGQQMIWVNRKGIIIGEYYLIGLKYDHKSSYNRHRAHLEQTIGAANLEDTTATASNLKRGCAVRYNPHKTISLHQFDGQSYLKVIDHTLE